MFINSKIDKLIYNLQSSRKGLTIQDIANEIGMSISTFNKIKSGLNSPSVDTLELIAKYFEVDMNYFFDMESEKKVVKTTTVKITDGNEYILKRFEEVIQENALLKHKLEAYAKTEEKSYTMPDVPNLKVAEATVELKK